ncbi:MAG: hypothetical protein HQL03_10615, partial [Nitrospirae bacterium]|nr:hypothetical protein [Nitrospirota bacterium]
MQMLLESRVDRLEVAMAELIELCRELKIEAAERARRQEESDRKYKEDKAESDRKDKEERVERDRRMAESDRKYKEEQAERHRQYEEDMRKLRRDFNQQMGHLANKMGTIVEDIIAPGSQPLIKQYFNCDPIAFSLRTKRINEAQNCEVDILIISNDKAFMIEVKSKPKEEDIDEILT